MVPKEAVEVLRGAGGYLYSHGMMHVNDAIDAVLDALEKAQRELAEETSAQDEALRLLHAQIEDTEQETAALRAQIVKERGRSGEEIDRLRAEVERLSKEMLGRLMEQSILFNKEKDNLKARVAALVGALERIERGDQDCACDHSNEHCCGRLSKMEFFCSHCVAAIALLSARAEAGGHFGAMYDTGPVCDKCGEAWPCSTSRAEAGGSCRHSECAGKSMPPGNLWCNTHQMERDCPKDASCPRCRAEAGGGER